MRVHVYPAAQECADLKSALITLLKATFKTYKNYFDSIHHRRCAECYLKLTSSITVEKQLTRHICHFKEATSLKTLYEEIVMYRLYIYISISDILHSVFIGL